MLRGADEDSDTMIVATTNDPVQSNGFHAASAKNLTLIVTTNSLEQHNLASQLSILILETLGMACEIVATDATVTNEHVIYLAELESPVIADPPEAEFTALKGMVDKARLVSWACKNISSDSEASTSGAANG